MVYQTNNGERPFLGASSQELPLAPKNKTKKTEITSDPFWFQELDILVRGDRIVEFVPFDELTYTEKLNAIMRFSVYAALLLFAYRRQSGAFLFPLFVAGLTLYMYKFNKRAYIGHETKQKARKCTHSTLNNPFMNVLMSDYSDDPSRPPACKTESEEKVEHNFRRNLYRNSFDDIYGRDQSRRQFYTMPVTDIEQSDYENYVNWLYNRGSSCKTDNSRCAVYEDVRYKRRPIQFTPE